VREGQPALIRMDAFRGQWFDGEVEKVGRATELSTDQSSKERMNGRHKFKRAFFLGYMPAVVNDCQCCTLNILRQL